MPWIPMRDGHSLHVRTVGRGRPVVLLHGFGSHSAHWLPNVLVHLRRFRFILPDLRGFGRSHAVPLNDGDVFGQYARDLADLLDYFNLSDVALGGISTGAYVCLVYNQEYGFDRVGRYLNIEHGPQSRNGADWEHGLFGERQDELFARFQALLDGARRAGIDTPYRQLPKPLRLDMRQTLARTFGLSVKNRALRGTIALAERTAEPLLAGTLFPVERWYAYLQVMEAFMHGRDTRPALSRIRVPTTLMVGMHSRLYPPAGQLAMREAIPHARVVKFHRSGHIPIVDEPLRFQRAFNRFLMA